MRKDDCWIIVPAMNEARRIGKVVEGIRKQGFHNVVVVDDGSTDSTAEKAASVTVLRHVINLGKGAAMKTGAEYALSKKAKALIFLDGDGQHDPEELDKFRSALNDNDVVFGARKIKKNMPLERKLGGLILRRVIRMFYGLTLHDPLCGYRAVTARAYGKIKWDSRDYGVESEMIARTGKEMLSHEEIEIRTIYHERYKGMTIPHGLRIVVQLIWWRMTH